MKKKKLNPKISFQVFIHFPNPTLNGKKKCNFQNSFQFFFSNLRFDIGIAELHKELKRNLGFHI